jgi:hypothetical protein
MVQSTREIACAVFDSWASARLAVEALRHAGFASQDVSLLMPTGLPCEQGSFAREDGETAPGAVATALLGGALGRLAGWLPAAGILSLPGVGLVIGAGALAAAPVGATGGAIIGTLLAHGVSENEARWYDDRIRAGRTVVAVHAGREFDRAPYILRQRGGYEYDGQPAEFHAAPRLAITT